MAVPGGGGLRRGKRPPAAGVGLGTALAGVSKVACGRSDLDIREIARAGAFVQAQDHLCSAGIGGDIEVPAEIAPVRGSGPCAGIGVVTYLQALAVEPHYEGPQDIVVVLAAFDVLESDLAAEADFLYTRAVDWDGTARLSNTARWVKRSAGTVCPPGMRSRALPRAEAPFNGTPSWTLTKSPFLTRFGPARGQGRESRGGDEERAD